MRIWITRAQPEADATAHRIRALGHEPVVAPLLEVRPVGRPPILEGVGALAFTSRNGVRAFAALTPERALPVFAVGDATAQAAREAGFAEVHSASGDVSALTGLVAAHKASIPGALLYAAPEEPAADLVAALEADGVPARAETVYRTAAAEPAPPPGADVVLVHSAKAARRLAAEPAVRDAAPSMTLICISPAAAAPLQETGFREVLIAERPDEAAMIDRFQGWAAAQPGPRLYTPLFWVVIVLGLACILAAMVIAAMGPRLFPMRVDQPSRATAQPLQIPRNSG